MLIDDYVSGPQVLRKAIEGMTNEQLRARPIPGKWSSMEVICHLADIEIICAERFKRIICENEPTFPGVTPELYAARLAYHERDAEEEILLIEQIRKHVAGILRALKPEDFQRRAIHLKYGQMTLETQLERIIGHIPHHVQFIEEKRKALDV
jgi:hypothetical protein